MMKKHTWTRITHYNLDFFFHVRAVAVDEAFAACAFFLLKRTFVKPQKCILFKFLAFLAYFAVGSVVVFAVEFNHVLYGFFLASYSFMLWLRCLRFHVNSAPITSTKCTYIRVDPDKLGFY